MNQVFSALNTVAASNADYFTIAGGRVGITGLVPFNKNGASATLSAASSYYGASSAATQQSFFTLSTNATISTTTVAGDTIALGNANDTFLGEVLTVTKAGLTYYAAVTVASASGTTTGIVWLGVNGTPANAAGYTVVRQGYAFTKVVFAGITAKKVQVSTVYTNSFLTDMETIPFGYVEATTATAAEQATAYHSAISTVLDASGYYSTVATDTVYILNPPNVTLEVVGATQSGYTSPTITDYVPVNRIGYGADIIAKYGLPTASSSTANDGIVATEFYDHVQISSVSSGIIGGADALRVYDVWVNVSTETTDGPALSAYIVAQLP